MKKVFFLVNEKTSFSFQTYITKYLSKYNIEIGESLPKNPNEYRLIVLWNYKKIIPNISKFSNIILFHASNLPEGKGWAPIYHTFAENRTEYIISGIFAADEVDSGDIIVKAKFPIKNEYTAEHIREFDNEISILLIGKILERFGNASINGRKQEGKESFYKRRYPKDNEIDMDSKISEIIGHIRGCEKDHPAFFYFNNIKYVLNIKPENKPEFPNDIKIEFFDES